VSVTKADKDHDSGSMVGVAAFAFGRSPSVALAAARPRLSADPLWRHGAAEVLIVGVVGSIEEERQSGLKVEDLVTGVEDDAAGPGPLHDVDRPVDGVGATDEVDLRGLVGHGARTHQRRPTPGLAGVLMVAPA
jgi:hypothetical protein